MNKLLLTFQEIKNRITGFSFPLFGVSWQPNESEIKIAQNIINQLEDRRVLYSPYELERPHYCIESILRIRECLTQEICKVSQNQNIYQDIQLLRAACRKFLDTIQPIQDEVHNCDSFTTISGWIFLSALGELRGIFGIIISKLSVSYGIHINGELIKIIPSNDIDE
jgi:hypothetical protein